MNILLIILLTVTALIILIILSLILDRDSKKGWVLTSLVFSLIALIVAPHTINSILFYLSIFCILLSILSFIISPKRKDRIYKIGGKYGLDTPPPVPPDSGLPVASIFDFIIKAFFWKREKAENPPEGYWSSYFPNPMVNNKEYEININFPATGFRDKDLKEILNISSIEKNNEKLKVTIIPIAPAFNINPSIREIEIKHDRLVKTNFLVLPNKVGKYYLRFEVKLNDTIIGGMQEKIKVHSSFKNIIIIIITFISTIAAILGILKNIRII